MHVDETFVREQRQRLRDEYGEVPVAEGTVEMPAAGFPACAENARDGYAGSARS